MGRGATLGSIASTLLVAAAALAPVARADTDEIQPDRPEVTESARLIPRGALQLETGFVASKQRKAGQATQHTIGIEADLRIGLTRQLELDIETDPFVRMRGAEDDTGFGDVTLGVRYRFVEGTDDEPWPPSFAVKPFVKIGVANEPIGTGRTDFGLLLLASTSLPFDFELEMNVGIAGIGQTGGGGYRPMAIASASVSRDIAPGLFGFVELFFTSREQSDEGSQLSLNAGLVYRVTRTFAVDAGVQTSLRGQAPDYVIRAGLSVLFGR